ncbi:MAG: hypothetical protein U1E30_04630 [Rhodoblastus sp.]
MSSPGESFACVSLTTCTSPGEQFDRASSGSAAGFESQVFDPRRPLAVRDEKLARPGRPAGLDRPGNWIVETGPGQIEVDVGFRLAVLQPHRQLHRSDRKRRRPRRRVRARRFVHQRGKGRKGRLSDVLAQIERRGTAEDAAAAGCAQAGRIAGDSERAVFEPFLADQVLGDEIRDVGVDEDLHIVAAGVGPDLEIEPQLPVHPGP